MRLLCVNRPGYGTSTRHASSQRRWPTTWWRCSTCSGRPGAAPGCGRGAYAVTLAALHPQRVDALGVVATLPMDAEDTTSVEDLVASYRPGFEEWVASLRPDDPDDSALTERWLATLPAADADLVAAAGPTAVAASVREALTDLDGYLRDAALLTRAWPTRAGDVRCPTVLWTASSTNGHCPAASGSPPGSPARARSGPRHALGDPRRPLDGLPASAPAPRLLP